MAKKTKKSRKNSKPNVFKQTTATNTTIDTNNEVSLLENKPSNKKVNSSNDQVYISGNSVSLELKKMGIISSSLLVILIILTFILG